MINHVKHDQPLVPTILDRLIDDDPEGSQEQDSMRYYNVQAMYATLKRDLEALLNARRRVVSVPRALEETNRSLLNYGLADITKPGGKSAEVKAQLCRLLARTMTQFEPRLTSLNVTVRDNADALDGTLHFRIEAVLNIEPAPELIQFDSFIEPVSTNIRVREARDV